MSDLLDQYERVARISRRELGFWMGMTDFYRARAATTMVIVASASP